MHVTVKGTGFRNQIAEASKFFADLLMDPRMVRNLNIEIEVGKLDVDGECVDEEGTRNPRWFTINLKKQRIEDMIKTLAHEMVHVKQHAKNELQTGHVIATRGGLKISSKWKGEIWKPKRKEDEYYDSPWELEAYSKEISLFYKFTTRHDKTKSWYVESSVKG
jgi:hypothetical protein